MKPSIFINGKVTHYWLDSKLIGTFLYFSQKVWLENIEKMCAARNVFKMAISPTRLLAYSKARRSRSCLFKTCSECKK